MDQKFISLGKMDQEFILQGKIVQEFIFLKKNGSGIHFSRKKWIINDRESPHLCLSFGRPMNMPWIWISCGYLIGQIEKATWVSLNYNSFPFSSPRSLL